MARVEHDYDYDYEYDQEYEYEPELKRQQAAFSRLQNRQPTDYVIEIEPPPEWCAQIEKNITKPSSH